MPWLKRLARLLAAMLLFVGAAVISPSLPLPLPGADTTLAWLPAGVALALMLRWGASIWPGIAAGAAIVALSRHLGFAGALLGAVSETLPPLVAAWALHQAGLRETLHRPKDLLLFGAAGALGAAALRATLLAVGADLLGSSAVGWYVETGAALLGVLLAGVPAMRLMGSGFDRRLDGGRWVATLLLTLASLAAATAGVLGVGEQATLLAPLVFLPHLLGCWLVARAGLLPAALTGLGVGLIVAAGTAHGHGPLVQADLVTSAMLTWLYLASLGLTTLVAAGVTGETAAQARRLAAALDAAGLGVAEWDLRHRGVDLSARWSEILGYGRQARRGDPESCWSALHPDDRERFHAAQESLAPRGKTATTLEVRLQGRDGQWKWCRLSMNVGERSVSGRVTRLIVTALDIGEHREAEERHQLSTRLFQHLSEGLLITDAYHRVVDANPMFTAITGYGREELVGRLSPLMRPAPSGSAAERQQLEIRQALAADGTWRGELAERRRSGEPCTLDVRVSTVKSPTGQVRFHAVAVTDVTLARSQREQLERQAYTDELTGLPNRARLEQMLRSSMQASEREGFLLTVCCLDLDHFKPINDRLGPDAGDRLLNELAQRLQGSLRRWASGDDTVARIAGDEFVLLLRTATVEEGRHAVERVMRQVAQPYGLGLGIGPVVVTASVGATVYPIDRSDAETLLRHAGHAMYGAKQAGRNGYVFFDPEHDRRTEARFEALGRVQEALEAEQFVLYFQPKVDMRSGKVLGMEALLRWRHPEHGVISPAQFLPLIEHTGLSAKLGDWVLQQGIEELGRWQRLGLDLTLSINVSARHLQEPHFARRLGGLLGRQSTPVGQRLMIEVLETAALADIDYTCALMNECKALGVRFALDDFGTGYSTFTYLRRLPLDMLKIDRSFVQNMLADHQDRAIVEGVIGLSQTFGCSVVAEGVETAEQARQLIELGCTTGQGNGIAPAMPADEVVDWVRRYSGGIASAPVDALS